MIDLLSGNLLRSEVKDFLAATVSVQDTDALIATLRLAVDSIGELLNILAVAGLIIIVMRHKLHSAPHFQSNLVTFKSVSQ